MQVAEELQAFEPRTHEIMSQAWIVWKVPVKVGNPRVQLANQNAEHDMTQVLVLRTSPVAWPVTQERQWKICLPASGSSHKQLPVACLCYNDYVFTISSYIGTTTQYMLRCKYVPATPAARIPSPAQSTILSPSPVIRLVFLRVPPRCHDLHAIPTFALS